MSETTSSTSEPSEPEKTEPTGGTTAEPSDDSGNKLAELEKRLEHALNANKRLSEKSKSLETQLSELSQQKTKPKAESGEALEVYKSKLEQAEAEKKSLQERFYRATVQRDLMTIADKYSTRPKILVDLIGDKFEASEAEDGSIRAVLKGDTAQFLDADDFVKSFVEKNLPETMRNSRAPGTGDVKGRSDSAKTGFAMPPDFNSWPSEKRKEFMSEARKDPEKWAVVKNSIFPSGGI